MDKKIILVLTAVLYVAMVAFNYLAGVGMINNVGTGAVSDAYQNLFTPAGYAFSIWGLIYLLLGVYTVYQFIAVRKDKKRLGLFGDLGKYYLATSFINITWLFAWHYFAIGLSVVFMFGLLFCLVRIANRLRKEKFSVKEKILVRLPFSLYFGWISVATIANITVFLVSLGWRGIGFSEVFWTVLILLVGTVIGSLRMLIDKNIPYGLVFLWAYTAILARHLSAGGFAGKYPAIVATLICCLILFFLFSTMLLVREKIKRET